MRTLEPRSIKQLLRDAGVPLGGAIRADVARVLDDSLFELWAGICEADGGEHAALCLFAVCSRDPSFVPPLWLELCWRRHRAAIVAGVHSGAVAQAADRLALPG